MIVKVRCPKCHGPFTEPLNEEEWKTIVVNKLEDVLNLVCKECKARMEK